MGIFSSILGGLFGLAGQSMQQSYTKENMKLQNVLNKDQMKYNDQLNRGFQDMLWNNQYTKEMSGMKSVGLNPATANGTSMGGMSASNNVGSGTSGPPGASVDIAGSAAAFAGIEQQQQQIDIARDTSEYQRQLMEAQRKYYEALAGKTSSETTGQDYANERQRQYLEQNGVSVELAEAYSRIAVNASAVNKSEAEIANLCKDLEVKDANIAYVRQETINSAENLKKIKEEIGAIRFDKAYKAALTNLAYEQANTEKYKQENLDANTTLTNNQNLQQVEETHDFIVRRDQRFQQQDQDIETQRVQNELMKYQEEVNKYRNPKFEGRSNNLQQFFAPIGSLLGMAKDIGVGYYFGKKGFNGE